MIFSHRSDVVNSATGTSKHSLMVSGYEGAGVPGFCFFAAIDSLVAL